MVSISVFFNIFAGFTTNILGLAYPSFRFLDAAQKGDIELLKTFGTYFTIFAAVDTLEKVILDVLIYYFPFYYVVKLVFLAWLVLPGYMVRN